MEFLISILWLTSTNTCALASPLGFGHALACTYRSNTALLKAILETTTDFPTFGMAHVWEGVVRVAHRHRKWELDCPKCTGCSPTLCDRMPKVSVTLGTEEVTLVLTTLCALGFYHPACTTTQSSHSASLRCVRVLPFFSLDTTAPSFVSSVVWAVQSGTYSSFVCTPLLRGRLHTGLVQTNPVVRCNSPRTQSASQAPKGRQPPGARPERRNTSVGSLLGTFHRFSHMFLCGTQHHFRWSAPFDPKRCPDRFLLLLASEGVPPAGAPVAPEGCT